MTALSALAVVVAIALGALVGPGRAFAHGDPTTHYLETDSLLTSYASPPDTAVELQLRGVLDAAAARGYPIKVVLFADENDTGGELAPLEDTQSYVTTISRELGATKELRAPVLIVTPDRFGVGGKQPGDGTLAAITPRLASELVRGLPTAERADGTALARTAIRAVRRLAAAGGHPLPRHIEPADQNLYGILGADRSRDQGTRPWLIALLVVGTVLLGALLVAVHRRMARKLELS